MRWRIIGPGSSKNSYWLWKCLEMENSLMGHLPPNKCQLRRWQVSAVSSVSTLGLFPRTLLMFAVVVFSSGKYVTHVVIVEGCSYWLSSS